MENSEYLKVVGFQLKKLRTDQNISQVQLAFEAGISRNAIVKYESGIGNMTLKTALQICKALEIEPDRLLTMKMSIFK